MAKRNPICGKFLCCEGRQVPLPDTLFLTMTTDTGSFSIALNRDGNPHWTSEGHMAFHCNVQGAQTANGGAIEGFAFLLTCGADPSGPWQLIPQHDGPCDDSDTSAAASCNPFSVSFSVHTTGRIEPPFCCDAAWTAVVTE